MRKFVGFIICLFAGLAAAQTANQPISPFVNEKTDLFIRVQPSADDIGKIEDFVMQAVGSSATTRPSDFEQFKTLLHDQLGDVRRWLGEFKDAGGSEILLVGQDDTLTRQGPVVIVPTNAQSNTKEISALLSTGHKDGVANPGRGDRAKVFDGKGVMFGEIAVENEINSMAPANRPEIAAGLAASNGAPYVFVLAPGTVLRREFTQNLPPMILTTPRETLVDGIQWVAQYATLPPQASQHLIIQTKDAATAQQVAMLMRAGLGMLKMIPEAQESHVESRAALARLLVPAVKGNQVVIDLDTDQVKELVRAVEPFFMESVAQSVRVQSMNNMRQILLGCVMYSNDHKGEWPTKLDDIASKVGGAEQLAKLMVNPHDPDRKPGYVYMKPKTPIAVPAQQMVLYEAHEKFGGGINVGFADGHIEFVKNPQRYKDLLLQSMQEDAPDQ